MRVVHAGGIIAEPESLARRPYSFRPVLDIYVIYVYITYVYFTHMYAYVTLASCSSNQCGARTHNHPCRHYVGDVTFTRWCGSISAQAATLQRVPFQACIHFIATR